MLASCAQRELSAAEVWGCLRFDPELRGAVELFRSWLHEIGSMERRLLVFRITGRASPAAPPRAATHPEPLWEAGYIRVKPLGVQPAEEAMRAKLGAQAIRVTWELLLPDDLDAKSVEAP